MAKKTQPGNPDKSNPDPSPEITPRRQPEEPVVPDDDPGIVPPSEPGGPIEFPEPGTAPEITPGTL